MAFDHIKNVKISAVCCAVPEDKLALEDFYKKFDKESGKIRKRYGHQAEIL